MNRVIPKEEKIPTEKRLRKSKTRTLLFEVLSESAEPLSILDILEIFASRKHHINKTTLYREVENLVTSGELRAVQIDSRRVSYELASLDHHHHFVCTSCDSVADIVFPEESIEKTEALLEKQGIVVTHHALEFFGVCKMCT
ncbi:MAG: transcriptional repressor [Patescibacteria group bacterium]